MLSVKQLKIICNRRNQYNKIMDKKYITIIGLVIAGAVFFSLVVMPMIKENRTQKYFAEQQVKFDTCLVNAWDNYDSNWELACENANESKDCTLNKSVAKDLNNQYDNAKITCSKLYK